jgi:hypothetical protein
VELYFYGENKVTTKPDKEKADEKEPEKIYAFCDHPSLCKLFFRHLTILSRTTEMKIQITPPFIELAFLTGFEELLAKLDLATA